jgi:alpha-glucosidase
MSNPTLTNDVTHDAANDSWWRSAVIYQVYIRSFADGDGDGTGDVAGLRSRLHYLSDLGVDAIWINPWYPSLLADGGYDVADFRDIHPTYGTLDDARKLITEAHGLGLRVILDIVPNHVSDQHAWFQEALAAPPGSPGRDRFVFRDDRADDGSVPPNDWYAAFGGPAWTRTPDGQWYLHLFAPEQPDLNWDNGEVRAEFESILRFWFDLGVDGFRIDVAHGMVKDPDLPDLGLTEFCVIAGEGQESHPHWDRAGVHDIFRSWRAIADSYPDPRVFVAEAHVRPGRLAVGFGGRHTPRAGRHGRLPVSLRGLPNKRVPSLRSVSWFRNLRSADDPGHGFEDHRNVPGRRIPSRYRPGRSVR